VLHVISLPRPYMTIPPTHCPPQPRLLLFSFTDTATTEIYTLSLHDALPISSATPSSTTTTTSKYSLSLSISIHSTLRLRSKGLIDRKSTRLNSSHVKISYAVFCLKKKKQHKHKDHQV